MDASENSGCGASPIRLIAVNPAGNDPATRIPSDGPHLDVPGEAALDAGPFTADASDASDAFDFEKNLAALRAGDSGQTFAATAEPAQSFHAPGVADGDGD
ncbi:hypothetical protein V6S67_09830 [Arthrobacter sp. Soc17.1.1.1]|uniref:hypothetical protein n=1 Tax=Arthrobacter sp. Soc17.1.1.1 TaxID=3121277 RepID=UPI002FE4DC74